MISTDFLESSPGSTSASAKKAMSSFSTVFIPIKDPAVRHSDQGTPMSQTTGAKIIPNNHSSVIGLPPISGRRDNMLLTSATSAISTISIAPTLTISRIPSAVLPVMVSNRFVYLTGSVISSLPVDSSPGIIKRAIIMAAGTLITEAVKIWPRASSSTFCKMMEYKIITDPATVAMPQLMTINNSLRDSCDMNGRINSGDSTMPRKILPAVLTPTAPPTPRVRLNT